MSTKIHHGYRLAEGTDLWAFCARLRSVMNPVRDTVDAGWLMRHAVDAVDLADRCGQPRPAHPLLDAARVYRDEQHAESAKGHTHLSRAWDPHSFEVSFGRDDTTGRVLCLLFTGPSEFVDAWEDLPGVEPYGYWNNTDRPDDVTDDEWAQRRAAWDRLLPGYQAPVESMVSFQLRAKNDYSLSRMGHAQADAQAETARRNLLASVTPSDHTRAKAIAFSVFLDVWRDRNPDAVTRPDSMQALIELSFAVTETLIDLAATVLTPVTEYVIGGTQDGSTAPPRPMDLSAVRAAAETLLDAREADR